MSGSEGRIFTGSEDRTIRCWDVDTGECIRVIRSHSGAVTGLCMAGNDRIVSGSADRKLRVFDTAGNLCGEAEFESEIMAVASLSSLAPYPIIKEAFLSPEATRGERGSSTAPHARPSCVQVIACGGVQIPSPAQPMFHIVDVNTTTTSDSVSEGEVNKEQSELLTAVFDNSKDNGVVTCAAISAAGAKGKGILIAGSYDKGVRVLHNVFSFGCDSETKTTDSEVGDENVEGDNDTLERAHTSAAQASPISMEILGFHDHGVRSVAISADGRWAVSGGREGVIKVWEIPEDSNQSSPNRSKKGGSKLVAEFEAHKGVVFSLCMSPNSRVLLSTGSDNEMRVWDLSLVVYARRLVLNHSRELWAKGRVRRARAKRYSGSTSPRRGGGGRGGSTGSGDGVSAIEAFVKFKDQRQHILENLFALPEIIYAKIIMYL